MGDVLRIAVVGDLHGQLDRLASTLEPLTDTRVDLALLSGDVGLDPPWLAPARWRHRQAHDGSVAAVIGKVRAVFDCPVVFVPGNHDLPDPPPVAGATNVDGQLEVIAGLRIAGLGGAGPARFGFPYEWTEQQAERRLARLFTSPHDSADIFLSHTPPAVTDLDLTAHGEHVGSQAVAVWLSRAAPRLFVCGHIHEAAGVQRLGETVCLNAGSLGEPHVRQMAWLVEWDQGPSRIGCWNFGGSGIPEWSEVYSS